MATLNDQKQTIAALLTAAALVCASGSARSQQPAGWAPCGIPMFVFQTGLGGMSLIYNGQPVIFVDPAVAYGDADIRQFVILHECGHHANGDTLPQGMPNGPFMSMEHELAADCYAARHAPNQASEAAAESFEMTQGDTSPALGYPTGNERAANIRRCAHIQTHHAPRPSGCQGLPPGMSLTCHFTSGPKAGHTQSFCGVYGATPVPVGDPCTDRMGSWGIAR